MDRLIGVSEVQELTGLKRSAAYALIRNVNKRVEEAGGITVPGKVSVTAFGRLVLGGCVVEGPVHVG
jgi:predicted DNA-binding transcriptional regulator AlpA